MSDISNPTIKKGGKQSLDLNASMGLGLFTSGISTTKMIDLSSKIGLVCPTKSTFVRNSKVLKKEILDLSNATKKNRKDHVTFVREQTNYRGDVKITKNRKVHSISTGAIAIDGAGNTRAYNHLIRGNQHYTVVF